MKFVNKKLAIKLKEKGFDRPCFGWYYINTPCGRIDEDINYYSTNSRGVIYEDCLYSNNLDDFYGNTADAPTIEQTLEWLREEKNIHVNALPLRKNSISKQDNRLAFDVRVSYFKEEIFHYYDLDTFYFNYEDAVTAGIEYAINNLI